MQLSPLATLAIAIGVAAFAAASVVCQRRMQRAAMQASFVAQSFDTPNGRVKGNALQVVKVSRLAASTPNGVEGMNIKTRDEFWYCVGPGPSYFLAIPTVGIRNGLSVEFVRWVIRPLSEERMRGALQGDQRAVNLAFGKAFDA